MIKLNFPAEVTTFFHESGEKLMADAEGCVQVVEGWVVSLLSKGFILADPLPQAEAATLISTEHGPDQQQIPAVSTIPAPADSSQDTISANIQQGDTNANQ